jgi:hypothetical protein
MRDMLAQYFLFHLAQRRARRRDLRDDVDAVAVGLDHAGDTADLAFEAAKPFQRRGLAVFFHHCYIPPQGI